MYTIFVQSYVLRYCHNKASNILYIPIILPHWLPYARKIRSNTLPSTTTTIADQLNDVAYLGCLTA